MLMCLLPSKTYSGMPVFKDNSALCHNGTDSSAVPWMITPSENVGFSMPLTQPRFQAGATKVTLGLYSDFDSDVGHYRRYSKKDILRMSDKFKLKITTIKYYDSIGFALSLLSKISISPFEKNIFLSVK